MCFVTPYKKHVKTLKILPFNWNDSVGGVFVFSAPSETPLVPQKLEIFTDPEMPATTPGN